MHTLRRISFVIPAALFIAACSTTDPNATHRISLSATNGSAHANGAAGMLADLVVTGTGGSVRITSAQIELSHIKLASDSTCSGDDDENDVDNPDGEHADSADADHHEDGDDHDGQGEDDDEDGCVPVRADPVIVDVPLDGTTKIFLDASVPAGTYVGLNAKLDSVNVVGVFTDTTGTDHPFTFASGVNAHIAVNFDTPVTVDANSQNLTIDVDVSSWFKTSSGAIIDPSNPQNQHAIERAIRASVRGFEDDNHDGDDDHDEGEHDGGGSGGL
jgi:hypothetical protein